MISPEVTSLSDYRASLCDTTVDREIQKPLRQKKKRIDPRKMMALTFVVLITLGLVLLCTPWAQASGKWAWLNETDVFCWSAFYRAFLDNLFMATSSSCVTGLTVVDVPTYYSTFGHVVLMCCVQLGGISLLTLGTLIVTILLGRVPVGGEDQVVINYGANSSSKANSLLAQTVSYVLTFECIGGIILFARYYWHHGYALAESLWFATFHAISAFCNAGISLHAQNLVGLRGDLIYTSTIALLVTLGGIGFLVIANVFNYHPWYRDLRRRGKISLHSRIVLWSSLLLSVGGGLIFTILEWNNALSFIDIPSPWQALSQGDWSTLFLSLKGITQRICAGISQTAMFRTAGFNFVEMDAITPPSNLLSVFLMLIGGSPGSMAGGIKTTTLVVLILTIRAYLRGCPTVELHRRSISDVVCREAMVIVVYYFVMVFTFYFVLLLTEKTLVAERGDFVLFYEVSSAFGTVGTSLNATPSLSSIGKFLIVLAMYLGRVGPISIALMMAGREVSHHIRYPEETITVG